MTAYAAGIAKPPRTLTELEQKPLLKTTGEHLRSFGGENRNGDVLSAGRRQDQSVKTARTVARPTITSISSRGSVHGTKVSPSTAAFQSRGIAAVFVSVCHPERAAQPRVDRPPEATQAPDGLSGTGTETGAEAEAGGAPSP
jgi:hypothetical protein